MGEVQAEILDRTSLLDEAMASTSRGRHIIPLKIIDFQATLTVCMATHNRHDGAKVDIITRDSTITIAIQIILCNLYIHLTEGAMGVTDGEITMILGVGTLAETPGDGVGGRVCLHTYPLDAGSGMHPEDGQTFMLDTIFGILHTITNRRLTNGSG